MSPFFQTTVIEKLQVFADDEGDNIVLETFLEQNQSTDSAVAVLERVGLAGRKILCKRYSTKVKNGAGKQGEFWPESLGDRKPWQSDRYARRHGVNAGLAAMAY